jgi:hypothetical protein
MSAPVRLLTSNSAYFAEFRSLEVTVPIQPIRNPNGIEIRPGFLNGK